MTKNEFGEQEAGGPPGRAGGEKARRGKSGTRSVPATPHDNLFRALVSDPGRAAALIRDHLPNRITGLLSETPPVPLDGSFVDEALRGSQSDMLFEVELASGGPALVFRNRLSEVLSARFGSHPYFRNDAFADSKRHNEALQMLLQVFT